MDDREKKEVVQPVIAGWGKPASAKVASPAPRQEYSTSPAQGGVVAAWLPSLPRFEASPASARHSPESSKSLYVVVSMTSVPARNGTLEPTIRSLQRQTRPPNEIRLYLGRGCHNYTSGGAPSVKCIRVEDRGPVTKLSAVADDAVRPDAVVVTVDDDIVFHRMWLETLLFYAQRYPESAVGMAGWNAEHLIKANRFERASGECDVIEGFAGVAYRKWFFGPDVLSPPEEIKFVDDVWISSYLHEIGIKRIVVPGAQDLIDTKSSDDSACGIHTRPDFLALNKRAASMGFSGRPLATFRLAERKAAAAKQSIK